jgi:hypothetical protein
MRLKYALWTCTLVAAIALAGCQKAQPTPTIGASAAGPPASGPGELDDTSALALGTLKLEGTADAVTPAQAAALLPLWQAIQSGALQGDAETAAVLKQIKGEMTDAQQSAIDAMGLTWEDVGTWMQDQGIEMPAFGNGSGQAFPGGGQNLSEDERAQLRPEFQNMTPEQRATRMAELGVQRPQGGGQGNGPRTAPNGGGPGGPWGRSNFMLNPLIDLLTKRAAE